MEIVMARRNQTAPEYAINTIENHKGRVYNKFQLNDSLFFRNPNP